MMCQEPRTGQCDRSPRFLFSGSIIAPSLTGFMQVERRREKPRQRACELEGCGPSRAGTHDSRAPSVSPASSPLQLHPLHSTSFPASTSTLPLCWDSVFSSLLSSFFLLLPPPLPLPLCLPIIPHPSAFSFLPTATVFLFSLPPWNAPFQSRRGFLYSIFFGMAHTYCVITDVLTSALPSCIPSPPTPASALEFTARLPDVS